MPRDCALYHLPQLRKATIPSRPRSAMPTDGTSSGRPKLSAEGLYKIFGSDPDRAYQLLQAGMTKAEIQDETGMVVGVQDATFTVEEGEIFVVMGLSGCGKSTLVRMLNRLIEPTYGNVLIDGRSIREMGRRELTELRRTEVSMVFQSFGLMPHLTVLDNAAYGLDVAHVPRSERDDRAMAALVSVGLKSSAHSYPHELSGGMQQRVGLARALAVDPAVLLMDEAFSALDPLIRTEMQDELLHLQEEHARTVVFISHDLDEAIRIGDRIAILQDGAIVQIGTPDEILRNPANDYVASFFRAVDVSQVLTAGDVAAAEAVTVAARSGTNLRSAAQLMHDKACEYAVVLDRDRHYRGVVTVSSVRAAMKKTEAAGWDDAMVSDMPVLPSDKQIREAMQIVAESPLPVPVVDDADRYVGVISQAMLLNALSRKEETEEDEPEAELTSAEAASPKGGVAAAS